MFLEWQVLGKASGHKQGVIYRPMPRDSPLLRELGPRSWAQGHRSCVPMCHTSPWEPPFLSLLSAQQDWARHTLSLQGTGHRRVLTLLLVLPLSLSWREIQPHTPPMSSVKGNSSCSTWAGTSPHARAGWGHPGISQTNTGCVSRYHTEHVSF